MTSGDAGAMSGGLATMGLRSVEALPENILDSTPSGLLVGPRKSWWRRFVSGWQRADKVHAGHLDGRPAWSFEYYHKERKSDFGGDTYVDRTKLTVAMVQREDIATTVRVRSKARKVGLRRREPKGTVSVGDEAFDERHSVWGHQAAVALLTPAVRATLLAHSEYISVDLGRGWIVVYRGGHKDQLPLVELVQWLATNVPDASTVPAAPASKGWFRRGR